MEGHPDGLLQAVLSSSRLACLGEAMVVHIAPAPPRADLQYQWVENCQEVLIKHEKNGRIILPKSYPAHDYSSLHGFASFYLSLEYWTCIMWVNG